MADNVRDAERVEAEIEETVEAIGGVDLMVTNTGGQFRAPFEEISENG